jgi:hypothetical protein
MHEEESGMTRIHSLQADSAIQIAQEGRNAMALRDSGAKSMPVERITRNIVMLRGHRVLLDEELAELYGVPTRVLNQAIKRNLERFPGDFLIQLTSEEWRGLRSQIVISNSTRGGRRHLPTAFTEHGAIMAATVINSPQAVEMSIYVVRAFVKLRELLASNKELAKRLDELETQIVRRFGTYDQAIAGILAALRELTSPRPQDQNRPIGFTADIK